MKNCLVESYCDSLPSYHGSYWNTFPERNRHVYDVNAGRGWFWHDQRTSQKRAEKERQHVGGEMICFLENNVRSKWNHDCKRKQSFFTFAQITWINYGININISFFGKINFCDCISWFNWTLLGLFSLGFVQCVRTTRMAAFLEQHHKAKLWTLLAWKFLQYLMRCWEKCNIRGIFFSFVCCSSFSFCIQITSDL